MNDQESPRVTQDMITAAIMHVDYLTLPDTQITVCAITLRNGAKVLGYNYGAIDPARQSWEQGRQAAYDMAREKIWELEGYALRERQAAGQKAGDRDALLKSAVDRFLCWDLPNDFAPDCHVSFDRDMAKQGRHSWPTGTNLLTAEQALAMFRHCLPGCGATTSPEAANADDWLTRLRAELAEVAGRLAKLRDFLSRPAARMVSDRQLGLMIDQERAMSHYATALDARIADAEASA